MRVLFFVANLAILIQSSVSSAAVWTATRNWTPELEYQYSAWVHENYRFDIFSNPQSKWYGLATDCADAAYAARVIFAAEHSLPVRFTNLKNSVANITNDMRNWDSYPLNRRVVEFIKYVGINTGTATLGYDTYPVKISGDNIRPGTIFLNPTLSSEEENILGTRGGHAETVIEVEENGFIRTLYSTTPRMVRDLITTRNPYTWPLSQLGGFRIWRNPETRGQLVTRLPGYSTEQFSLAGWGPRVRPTRQQIYQWHESIRRVLRVRPPTVDERIDVVAESICNLWQGRVIAVNRAWREVMANGGRCLSAGLMDDHSTQKRDARIREAYGQLNDLMYYKKNEYSIPDARGDVKDAKDVLKSCTFHTSIGFSNSWEMFLSMIDGNLNSDSAWEPAVRWGYTSKVSGRRCR
ncbi:hypothetical protein D3C72_865490 [compost metagenome]